MHGAVLCGKKINIYLLFFITNDLFLWTCTHTYFHTASIFWLEILSNEENRLRFSLKTFYFKIEVIQERQGMIHHKIHSKFAVYWHKTWKLFIKCATNKIETYEKYKNMKLLEMLSFSIDFNLLAFALDDELVSFE